MKNYSFRTCLMVAGLTLATTAFANVTEDAGYVDLGKFTAADGCEYVEVNIKSGLLKFAAKIAAIHEPEAAELLRNIKLVRVNVVGMDDTNRKDTVGRITAIRADLETKGWEKIVTVREGKDKKGHKGDDVAVYIKTASEDAISGVVVTVMEKNGEAIIVNIVGHIRAEQIADLGERLDIKELRRLKISTKAEAGA